MKTALLIMAAGLGSRFGGGIKQLTPIGPNGEIIMDYSIHDAIDAGFSKIILVIRKDIEEDFRTIIGERIEKVCRELNIELAYAYQSLDDIPAACTFPEGRTKPWGTGHAILAARHLIDSPFAVINADDYYGKEGFRLLNQHLVNNTAAGGFAMAGFILGNTLSENGGVSRGICTLKDGYLADIVETHNIIRTADGADADGNYLPISSIVSMNMWGLTKEFVSVLENGFEGFINGMKNPLKDEYQLPTVIRGMLAAGDATVRVLKTDDQWFGVTYQQDREKVINAVKMLVATGVYASDLYSDLKR